MNPTYFGAEQVTDEDRGYRGSRFSEVRDAIFANPYQKVWGGAVRSALSFSAGGRKSRRFEGRSALGRRSQRFPADHSSQRNMSDWPLGNIRTDALFRLFSNGEPSADSR